VDLTATKVLVVVLKEVLEVEESVISFKVADANVAQVVVSHIPR